MSSLRLRARRGDRLRGTMIALLGMLLTTVSAAGQSTGPSVDPAHQITNARFSTRAATTTLTREIDALIARGETGWLAYRLPTANGAKQMCSSWSSGGAPQILLEPPTQMTVLIRIEAKDVVRVQTATPECAVDAGGLPVLLLTGIAVSDSVDWLSATIATAEPAERPLSRRLEPALAALAWHPGEAASRALVGFAREDARPSVRSKALFWLGQRAGREALATLGDAVNQDPDTEVKKKAVAALGQLPPDQGVPLLITIARTHANPQVRRQAMFWLGQSHDPRAVTFFEEVLSPPQR